MEIKHAIFDVGNVCYPYTLEYLNQFCYSKTNDKESFIAKKGVLSYDYRPFMLGKIDFHEFCRELCYHCKINYYDGIENVFNQKMHDGVGDFYPETLGLMKQLKQKNIEISLLSNALPNLEDTADKLVKKDRAFTSYKLHLLKPDVKIYQYVLDALHASPNEVVFIDDKASNVNSAQKIGINGIVYNRQTIVRDFQNILNRNFLKINFKDGNTL